MLVEKQNLKTLSNIVKIKGVILGISKNLHLKFWSFTILKAVVFNMELFIELSKKSYI